MTWHHVTHPGNQSKRKLSKRTQKQMNQRNKQIKKCPKQLCKRLYLFQSNDCLKMIYFTNLTVLWQHPQRQSHFIFYFFSWCFLMNSLVLFFGWDRNMSIENYQQYAIGNFLSGIKLDHFIIQLFVNWSVYLQNYFVSKEPLWFFFFSPLLYQSSSICAFQNTPLGNGIVSL